MGNKKVLSKATRELNKTKRVAAPKNIIEDPRGQWAHPGEITRIPSDRITMQGVPYPVMAYPNMGEPQMMYPGGEYYFPGADYVDEYPELKKGGTPKSLVKMPKPSKKGLASKKFSRSLDATNRLFTENPLFAKPKSKKRKVFDPNAYYQEGGEEQAPWNPDYEIPTTYEFQSLSPEEIAQRNLEQEKERARQEREKLILEQENWTPAQWTQYRKQEDLKKYQQALVDEPKYFSEGKQFVNDWHNSPMYNKMVLNSYRGNQAAAEALTKLRKQNIASMPDVNIMKSRTTRFNTPAPAAWADGTQVDVFPAGFGEGPSLYVHEGLHASDSPKGHSQSDKSYKDPRFPEDDAVWLGRLMPASDQMYMLKNRAASYKDNSAYNEMLADSGYKIPTDEEIKQEIISEGISSDDPNFDQYFNKVKNQYVDSFKGFDQQHKRVWQEHSHNYVSNPTEVRARLGEIRYSAKNAGIYNPFTEELTPEKFQEYINNKENRGGAFGDLREQFTDEEILWMLNNISKNDDPNQELNFAQNGGEPGDKFKKRLMKRYPGMQDVYGPEGENLSIVKDPNYDARSAGYGDIEFTFPGDDPVLNYPNLVEEGGPDYNYPNPSPDKYTVLYNPRGANRGDIFLDMMHGMRDDPNYQPLLQNFEKAVRDARGEDMDYYYDDQVKKGSTQSKERYDENYVDSQLRAELAPGSIGMFSKGRRDYRQDRKYDSPEMRAAAKDIRNYLKGKPAEEDYVEAELTPEEIEEYRKGGFIVEELDNYQEGGSPDPKTNFYTVEGSGGVYRKVNGKWEVDWNRSGKFQPLSKGDVKKRAAVLDKKAKPLYDTTYDDLYTTQRSAYTAPAKSTPAKKPTAQDKAAQEQFDKNFQVTGKSKMEVVEDKIQKTADDYAKYHQQQTGKPLTQEEYDDAYQDIYNRAYVDAGVYKPTMSGPTINPYGTTEERKNLVSLDPGKAPKNLTLGDYVDKGWDVVTNPLDYASYALKPKGTVTTPWNMTNYENRLEAAGLEDPVTANNNVNKAIDFASYFIGPGMVAQGLKMVPGTVNSIGRAFENPSWENTGDALFDAGMTALSIAPGFGIAKNLAKPASTLDDLKAIEALRGNTATTPFQSYYLTGNRALGTSEAAQAQAQALRRFIDPQSPQLPAGRSPIMSESTRAQLTNPAVDSYFPVRFGDEPYAAAGNEFYHIDPEDYNILNEATQKLETDPNWRQEGLKDAYFSMNSPSNKTRGTGPDFFKGINYEFKDFSPGWQAARDAKDLIMPAQRMPKRSDYFSRNEFYGLLEQEMRYKILDDERKIQEALTGKKITDAEFAEMNPGVTRPDFTQKMLTDDQRKVVNDLLRDNPSVKSNPLLKENLEAAVARSERRENALPISVTIRQDLEKYPVETLISYYGNYAGVSPEQAAKLSPEKLEQVKQTIIENIAKAMNKTEQNFAKNNPFRSGDMPISLNRASEILPKGKIDSKNPLDQLAALIKRKRSKSEISALDDLDTIRLQSKTGQANAEELLNAEIEQKLKDLDTPEGRRRVQKYIEDNNLVNEEYDPGNFNELATEYQTELPRILADKYSDESQRIVELVRNKMAAGKKAPSLAGLKSWNELEAEHILNNPILRMKAYEAIVPADPRYTGGTKSRPFTHDEYVERIENILYKDVSEDIDRLERSIKVSENEIKQLAIEKNTLNRDLRAEQDLSMKQIILRRINDTNRRILDAHNRIAFNKQSMNSLGDYLNRENAGFRPIDNKISLGEPYTAIGDLLSTMTHEIGHSTEMVGNPFGNSAIDRALIKNLTFRKKAPSYLYKKFDPDKARETAPSDISNEGIKKYRDPEGYFKSNLNYFKAGNKMVVGDSNEPTAFAVEMRPALKELGLIKGNFDIVTPGTIEKLYVEYITNPKFQFRDLRIFDIMEPTKKNFKELAKHYNDIKSLLPYAIPVGLGVGATGLAGQEAIQEDMEYQDGGIIMELSDDEIQQYANGGFVVEELEYRPDAGKTLNKKVAAKPKTTINTEGLAYRPSASTKPQNPNAKANVQTNPSQQRQQNVQVPKPKVITDSMSTVLDKYAIGDTSPIMSIDVFQDIITKQNQEKQAKLEILQRQLEASQAGTSSPNPAKRKQPSITQYEFTEEFIKGMPNVRTEQSESYLGGRPLKNEVKKVVLHHTGSTDEKNNNKYVHNHFMNPDSETSAHVVIEEDGTRTVYASPDQVTFHAGKSTWDGRTNVNDFGVGIEFQGDTNVKPLTSAQIRSFVEYFDQLAKKYNVSTQDIITHAMIAPGRKPDITESQYKRILKYLKERGYE